MHFAELWRITMEQSAIYLYLHAASGVHLHVLACLSLFFSSGSKGCIMLKCGLLLYPLSMLFTQVISRNYLLCACAVAHLFKKICSLPLVRPPKGVLLVIYLKFNLSRLTYPTRTLTASTLESIARCNAMSCDA